MPGHGFLPVKAWLGLPEGIKGACVCSSSFCIAPIAFSKPALAETAISPVSGHDSAFPINGIPGMDIGEPFGPLQALLPADA